MDRTRSTGVCWRRLALLSSAALLMQTAPALAVETVAGDSCAGFATGAFRQSAGDGTIGHLLICDGTNWQPLLSYNADGEATTIGSQSCTTGQVLGYNGSIWACSSDAGGLWEVDSNIMRPKSGTADYANDDFVFGSYQLDDTTNAAHDNRMFFDKSKAAFRAGFVSSTEWDTASVGDYSAALGANNQATGYASTAFGQNTRATGARSTAFGTDVRARGNDSLALGYRAWAGTGSGGTGAASVAMGLQTQTHITAPVVSGLRTLGIFMDGDVGNANSGKDITGNDLFAIVGGSMVIDNTNNTITAITGGEQDLELAVLGDVGAANYCDEDGNNCFTAASVSGGSSLWTEGAGSIYYNSGTPLVGIGNTSPDAALDVTGDIQYTGVIQDVSDRRMKTDIHTLSDDRGTAIGDLIPVSFAMKDGDDTRELGFIAQDVEQVFPELVQTSKDGIKSMNYVGLIAPMVKVIQQLQADNTALQAKVEALECDETVQPSTTAKPLRQLNE